MGSEVMGPRLGELRASDLLAVYQGALVGMPCVDVIVWSSHGAVAARVSLGRLPSGRRCDTALICDGCNRVVRLLLTRHQDLRCRKCLKVRTNHQRKRTTADWVRRGDREADRFLRLIANPARRLTPTRLDEARQLAREIIDADHLRVAFIRDELAMLRAEVE